MKTKEEIEQRYQELKSVFEGFQLMIDPAKDIDLNKYYIQISGQVLRMIKEYEWILNIQKPQKLDALAFLK